MLIFARVLENYVAGPGPGKLNQRLISRNTANRKKKGRMKERPLPLIRVRPRGSHQVILERRRTRQRSVIQLEQARTVAANDTPIRLCLEVCLGVWLTGHWSQTGNLPGYQVSVLIQSQQSLLATANQ